MKDHNIEVFDNSKAVLFKNWTSEKFSYFGEHGVIQDENCRWNGQAYSFLPGDVKFLPEGIAHHFAKHLTNKVLLAMGKPVDDHTRHSLYSRCFEEGTIQAPTEESLGVELIEKEMEAKKAFCDTCDSKGVKHKKDCPKNVKPSTDSANFE
jgi:hypothetical protein